MDEKNLVFYLRMLHEFKSKNIPSEVFSERDKDYLILHDYVYLTVNEGYVLTEKGLDVISRDPEIVVKVQYPLMVKGRIKSYNKVISTMSEDAANALLCAMITENFMGKITNSNTRIFMQHLLDTNNYHKWGESIIRKYKSRLDDSVDFFEKSKRKRNV